MKRMTILILLLLSVTAWGGTPDTANHAGGHTVTSREGNLGKGTATGPQSGSIPLSAADLPESHDHATTDDHGRHGLLSASIQNTEVLFLRLQAGFQGVTKGLVILPGEMAGALSRIGEDTDQQRMILALIGLFAAGVFCEYLFRLKTAPVIHRIADLNGGTSTGRLSATGQILGIGTVSMTLFALTVVLFHLALFSGQSNSFRLLFTTYLAAILIVRTFALASNFLLAPESPRIRLVRLSNADARFIHRWGLILFSVGVFGWLTCGLMHIMAVLAELHTLLVLGVGTLIFCILIGLVRFKRRRFGVGATAPEAREGLQGVHLQARYLLIHAYLGLVYLVWTISILIGANQTVIPAVSSLLVLPVFLVIDHGFKRLLVFLLPPVSTEPAPSKEEEAISLRQTQVLTRVFRIVLSALLAMVVIGIWGISLPAGGTLFRALFNISITLLFAYGTWELTRAAIDRRITQGSEGGSEEEEEEWGSGTRTRAETLLPLFRKFTGIVLTLLVALIVLSSMGVDIAPLMAGAGVVGLAIGFGAQKLVRDILSGIFFLLDDAFRVGEYVETGDISGTVEEITLRTIKLRHHRGMLQIVPLGDLASVTNYMRGGIVVKFNINLPYDTDIEKVRKIIKKVGKAMLADEALGPDFIKPVKSQGIRKVGDSVMTVRVKFTARPGAHFVIRREALKRITEALEKKGIRYAHRKVIVAFDQKEPEKDGETAAPDPRAAAAAALEQIIAEKEGSPPEKEK